jgi:hypothetical protein
MTAKQKLFIDYLHVFVLANFALAQPLLYRLSRKTVFMEDQGIERGTVFLLVGLLCLVAPALLCTMEVIAGWVSDTARERTHRSIAFLLLTVLLWPIVEVCKFLPGMIVVMLAPALACLGVVAYCRTKYARWFVTAAAPAIAIFPGYFLLFSPASKYLFPRPEPAPVLRAVRNSVPIVMIVFDEFYGASLMNWHGELDAARFPNFAALAETATWYRNATSVHARTEMAVPSLLTGNYPSGRRPATIAEYPANLFSLLESTGAYDQVVFEPYTRLSQPKPEEGTPERKTAREQWTTLVTTLPQVYVDHLLPSDLPIELPDVPMAWNALRKKPTDRPEGRTGVFRYHWNSSRAEQYDEFLRRIEPSDRPALYFAHIVVPHFPWCFLPSGRRYLPDDGSSQSPIGSHDDNAETWGNDELGVIHGYQRFLLQVGYADHLVGKVVDRLRATELFDRCLLIVTADHGVSFRPGRSRRIPDREGVPDVASIPIFIKLPGQRLGGPSDRNVESVDVLPTIIDVVGLADSPRTAGTPLVEPIGPERPHKRFHDGIGTVTIDAGFPARNETLTRMLDQLGDGSEPDRFFRFGPHRELVGQPIERLAVNDRANIRIEFIEPVRALKIEPTKIVPCFLVGRVHRRDAARDPIALAIAVNGTIRAVTRTYTDKTIHDYWSALLPESSIREGDNEVRVFVINSIAGKRTLAPATDEPLVVAYAP